MPKAQRKRQRKPQSDEQKILRKICKQLPSHVVEIELQVAPEQSVVLQRIQEHLRVIRNTVLGELKKRYDQMVRTKTYKRIIRQYRQISEKLEKTTDEKHIAPLAAEMKKCRGRLDAMREAYHVTFNDARRYGEMLLETKFTLPDSVTVWSACEMAWHSVEGLLFRNAERVYFYQRDDLMTLQGKQAERSVLVKYEEKCHAWMVQHAGMTFPLIVKPNDLFIEETLAHIQHYRDHAHV